MRRTAFDLRGGFRPIVVVHLRAGGFLLADAGSTGGRISRALIYQRRRQIIDVEPRSR
jgi:hypothetical protein